MRKLTLILSMLVFTLASTTLKAQNAGTVESKQNSGSTGGDVGPTVVDTPKPGAAAKPYSATNSGAVPKAQAAALNSPISASTTTTQSTAKTPVTSSSTSGTTGAATASTTSNASNTDSSVATTDSTNSSTAATGNNNTCTRSCNWGWLGLLGLLGLFGLLGKKNKV